MICGHRDPDLLLLAHGELSRLRRFQIERHLQSCDRCRKRHVHLLAVSGQLASAIRDRNQPLWSAKTAPALLAKNPIGPAVPWTPTLGLLVLLGILAVAFFARVRANAPQTTPTILTIGETRSQPSLSGGCRHERDKPQEIKPQEKEKRCVPPP